MSKNSLHSGDLLTTVSRTWICQGFASSCNGPNNGNPTTRQSSSGKFLEGCMNFASHLFRLFTRFVLISALLSLGSQVLLAQDATGRIVGTISDPSGAVVVGVHVVVTNTATHVSREATTDSNGYYQVLSLSIGSYTVSANHKGFSAITTSANTLDINQSVRIDIKLQVGSTSESVTVETTATTVET